MLAAALASAKTAAVIKAAHAAKAVIAKGISY
jgi:hypothetical protein